VMSTKADALRIEALEKQLEELRSELAFTKLSLEDEAEKVLTGIEIIRQQQEQVQSLKEQEVTWEAEHQELTELRAQVVDLQKENQELRFKENELEGQIEAQASALQVERKATEGLVGCLKAQIQQVEKQNQIFEDIIQKTADSVPENKAHLSTEEVLPPISLEKAKSRLEQKRTLLNQCVQEISSKLPQSSKNCQSLTKALDEYHKTVDIQMQQFADELSTTFRSMEASRLQLFQERENEQVLLETMEELEQQISQLMAPPTNAFSISVFVPEVKLDLGGTKPQDEPIPLGVT